MHIWVDFFRLPLRKSGEAYHMTSPHWRGTEEHHMIFPSHWDWKRSTSRDLSSPLWWGAGHVTWSLLITVMVSWTMKMRSGGQSLKLSDWLLGLKWIDMGCFRSDLGPRAGDFFLPPVSPLSSQVTVPLIGHSPLLHNYHFSHLSENPFFLGWRLKRRNLNLEVFLWLLLHQQRMPHRMSDLFLNGHTFEQIVLIPTLSKRRGELSVNINEATNSTAKDLGEIKV